MTGAIYPGLEAHSCHGAASRLGFFGGFFAVEFRPEWDCPEVHRRLVSALIHEARLRKLNLVAEASFGLERHPRLPHSNRKRPGPVRACFGGDRGPNRGRAPQRGVRIGDRRAEPLMVGYLRGHRL